MNPKHILLKICIILIIHCISIPILTGQVQEEWAVRHDGSACADKITGITVDSEGNVIVTGWSDTEDSDWDILTVKYSDRGDELWSARYNGSVNSRDFPARITRDCNDNIYVAGYSEEIDTSYDGIFLKYSPDGDLSWSVNYDGPAHGSQSIKDLVVNDDGNIYVAIGTGGDYLTIKYDTNCPTSNRHWATRYSQSNESTDSPRALEIDHKGNVYVTGISREEFPNYDIATVKYDSLGNEQWSICYDGPISSHDYGEKIGLDREGYLYIGGNSRGKDMIQE